MTLSLTTLGLRVRGCDRIPMSQLHNGKRDISAGTLNNRAECITGTAQAICYGIRKVHRRKRRKYLIHLAEDAFRILNAVCTQQVEGVATTFGCCFSKAIQPGGWSDTKGIPAWQVGSAEECKQAARLGELFVRILHIPGVEQLWVRLHQLGHPRDFERGGGKRCVSSIQFASVHRTDRVRTGTGKGAPVSQSAFANLVGGLKAKAGIVNQLVEIYHVLILP
jgi:hypothetical protein